MNNLLKTAVKEERIDEIRNENYQGKLPRSRGDDEKLNQQGCIAGLTSLEDAPTSTISYPASPSRINCFIKNPTTHNWESEEKKWKKGTQLQRKPKERNHFPIKCNKQKGRENLSTCCNVSGQSWMNSIKLAEENVRASLLKNLLYLSVLNCCKWSLVS